MNRRLAAILLADVVGYSAMMSADENGTLAALKHHRETIFDPAVAAHNGRVVKLMGDGTLVEFSSVVDAVNCALAIQRAIKAEEGAEGGRITLRIGVNLGDIVIDGGEIYGDGVNVAARLEPLADPGGICISSIVNESIGARTDAVFRDAGEVQVKNIGRPVRVWKWHPDMDAGDYEAPAPQAETTGAKAGMPSVAVLPFDNMSGDPEQEYFTDGISEDIITDLSKVGGLLVIARNSSFAYKGKSVDIRDVGRELGVMSVLEGSIRRAGNRVRINAQLIDARSGGHLWADRFDRELTDIFEVQDEVTRKIVDALKVTLTPTEEALITDNTATSVEAHDLFLQARQELSGSKNKASFEKATALLKRAIDLDPDYGEPYAGLALACVFDFQNRWTDDPDRSVDVARRYADLAIEKAPKDAYVHHIAAIVAAFARDFDRNAREIEKALELSPNFAAALASKGANMTFSGRAEEAFPYLERAMRLDPQGSEQYLHFMGLARLLLGNYETAAAEFRERIRLVPDTDFSRVYLASALGHLGEIDEARKVWDELMAINPDYSFESHMSRAPFRKLEYTAPIYEGLKKAGLVG
ncbi:guanylyl cyclase [Stappia sp. GBMRC 2046]|uniref:Guanylyl cyclase n=1 Tax=Stappia sediminis TaxID=2692190 RepID=A0A7X3LWX8_9HYPH|nr:adenylate/guanylate cyclase domain-containing protein [Stappia sediminis]MXN66565.1 guanylyl cyclase [Stappia sediminis]